MRIFAGISCLLAITLLATCVRAQEATSRPAATSQSENHKAAKVHGSSKVKPAKLILIIPPIYPPQALAAGGPDKAVVKGVIAKDGTIQSLENVGGADSPFVTDVIAAVSKWRFTPQLAKGRPVEEQAYFAASRRNRTSTSTGNDLA